MPLINGPKKVKPNQEKFESKSTAPPAPEFKQTKQIIEIDSPQSQQALKKPPPEIQQSKRPPITQEYENSISYSQRPIQKNPNQMNREAFFQNKIKFLPHVKLRDSGFGNTFIPVLPSFLTEL